MNKYFWSANPKESAKQCELHFPERMSQVVARADEICENTFLFTDHWEMERTQNPMHFPKKIDWAYVPFGDVEWLYELNRHTCFVNLGKAYCYTRQSKYDIKFAALIEDFISRAPLTEESGKTTWRSLEVGLRCENWLRALELFDNSPVLTQTLRNSIEDCLKIHMTYLAKESGDFQRLSNWGILQDHGLLLLGIHFDVPVMVELAGKRLDEQLHLQVFRDGSHWEQSPMYHCEVLHCCLDVLLVAKRNGICLPARFVENTRRLCHGLVAWCKPDGRLICQSDSDDTDARDLLVFGALLFEDGSLKYAAGLKVFEETLWDFGPQVWTDYQKLQAVPPNCFSTALPDSGNYVLRAGAGKDVAWLHMHCGCLGSGHGHADLLHVDIGAFGEDILIDSGRYTYVNTPLRRRLKLPSAHNTCRIDETDFSTCVDSWAYSALAMPIKGEYTFTDTVDYLSGMHMGYWNLPGGGVLTGRKIFFLKPDIFVVFDQFYGCGKHVYEQFFHFGAGDLKINGQTAIWSGNKGYACMRFLGDVSIEQGKAPYSKDYNALSHGDALRITRQGEGFCSFITAIAVSDVPEKLHNFSANLLTVSKVLEGQRLPEEKAQGIEIALDGKKYTVAIVNGEIISGVDLLKIGTYTGYGKALVFTPETPDGSCFVW